MDLVWGAALDTSDRTVDAHVKLLRAKLRARGVEAELIERHGYAGVGALLKPEHGLVVVDRRAQAALVDAAEDRRGGGPNQRGSKARPRAVPAGLRP